MEVKLFVERYIFAPVKVDSQKEAHQFSLLHYQEQINRLGRPMVGSGVENDV